MDIKVQIDCDGEYCGDCWKQFDSKGRTFKVCREFINDQDDYIELESDASGEIKRCQQCLDAEIKDE